MARQRYHDGLALRQALPGQFLPFLVAAMAFLAALALAGGLAAHGLSQRWTHGAGAVTTVQVPRPDDAASADGTATPASSRIAAVQAVLSATPAVAASHRLGEDELRALLAPWIEQTGDPALPLPAVIELRTVAGQALPATLMASLQARAPGVMMEHDSVWSDRLAALAGSLQACALLAVLVVTTVAVCVVMAATRAGLLTRRQAIALIHSLGATDSYISGRFATRVGLLALGGGLAGSVLALPMLGVLSWLAAPFGTTGDAPAMDWRDPQAWAAMLPHALLWMLVALPPVAGLAGWTTTQLTVRAWLRRLP
ncbi:cell division protein FtsX [Gluconacetobacter sp. SXCC-1]|uniref:FtsX-like permease family protein n=2 Tax=Komagataeibacter rhaeticus TaxID=215221 RepID=A0A858JIP1_9PROT|nr:FtsX-like permease family protein [Komagataeibacter rhaeticus]ATU71999.1 cell division protein FtsX [Komagataeibacter xylinus]EGG75412.1 cell division protein FtsX [Gluconacetobacter sp. SXCC-1]QIP35880.1 FtsX-like permease family protein [Komagataeibacter rhaeticus]QOC45640.1 FtsX-like permease family protein [Komagataeibacter rhaeticus]WPP21696.1 FtsX-like permease family protein [Komagataeibacter rhaeticus]